MKESPSDGIISSCYDRDWRALDMNVREFQVRLSHGRFVSKDITIGECMEMRIKSKHDAWLFNFFKTVKFILQNLYKCVIIKIYNTIFMR